MLITAHPDSFAVCQTLEEARKRAEQFGTSKIYRLIEIESRPRPKPPAPPVEPKKA